MALLADSFRIAARSAIARPPHTKAVTAIMVIQVAVVMGAAPFRLGGGCPGGAADERPCRERENRVGGDCPSVRDPRRRRLPWPR